VLLGLHGEDNSVQHLTLDISSHIPIAWTDLAPEFRKAFQVLASSPHLVSLTIKGATSLPPIIVAGPSLQKLHFASTMTELTHSIPNIASLPYPSLLEEIFIDHSHTFYRLATTPKSSKLRKVIALNRRSQDFPKLWNILFSASHTLEHIRILQT
jgi:hypothetical protein